MHSGEMEFELDDDEIRFETEEDPIRIVTGSGDFGPPVDVDGEVDEDFGQRAFGGGLENEYATRLYEMSQREFESDTDRDEEIEALLSEMEREYFLGGLVKKIASGAGSALKKAASTVARSVPGAQALKSVTQLASSALKGGMLKPLAQAALSFVPGGSMVLPALDALGFGAASAAPQAGAGAFGGFSDLMGGFGSPLGGAPADMSKWMNLASLFQNAFGQLAARTEGEVSDPTQAMRLATESFQAALRDVRGGSSTTTTPSGLRRRVIYVGPNEEIVIRVRSS